MNRRGKTQGSRRIGADERVANSPAAAVLPSDLRLPVTGDLGRGGIFALRAMLPTPATAGSPVNADRFSAETFLAGHWTTL
jgi:hypothetical protein